ncbi:hypothetical protein PG993_013733 [Apiospora rasikravindrae]|uniref:Uncharacterized protein n=1 Tax=Apiospora rasikravindrae TaxID=990691 RepID=A0ABR1RRE7_9PEZI
MVTGRQVDDDAAESVAVTVTVVVVVTAGSGEEEEVENELAVSSVRVKVTGSQGGTEVVVVASPVADVVAAGHAGAHEGAAGSSVHRSAPALEPSPGGQAKQELRLESEKVPP